MKNAREYRKKIKKLLRGLKSSSPPAVEPGPPRVRLMVELILQADATRREAAAAMGSLEAEYVDFNEMRVSPVKDMTEVLGKEMPFAREKVETIVTSLNNIFARTGDVWVDWLDEVPKRELRRTLMELGLGPYAGAAMAMMVFGVPAVPVDRTLVECLKADEYVHPDSDIEDVQAFLEKAISSRQALSAHQALRKYCEKRAKTLPKKPVAAAAPPVEAPPAPVQEPPREPAAAEAPPKAEPKRPARAGKKPPARKGAKRSGASTKAKAAPPRAKRTKKSTRKK